MSRKRHDRRAGFPRRARPAAPRDRRMPGNRAAAGKCCQSNGSGSCPLNAISRATAARPQDWPNSMDAIGQRIMAQQGLRAGIARVMPLPIAGSASRSAPSRASAAARHSPAPNPRRSGPAHKAPRARRRSVPGRPSVSETRPPPVRTAAPGLDSRLNSPEDQTGLVPKDCGQRTGFRAAIGDDVLVAEFDAGLNDDGTRSKAWNAGLGKARAMDCDGLARRLVRGMPSPCSAETGTGSPSRVPKSSSNRRQALASALLATRNDGLPARRTMSGWRRTLQHGSRS